MWQMQRKELQSGRIEQYQIVAADGSKMSYAQVVDCWGREPEFASFFSGQLASSAFDAFLWETPPVSRTSIHRPFECVLIDSPPLARAAPDATAFTEHFAAGSGQVIVSFDNLGGDARLISPCPLEPATACTHLAVFLRDAPVAAVVQLWQQVSVAITNALNDQPLWVSSCGLGVYWLHVRLDSFPKYYRYTPYQSPG
ncbi:DUF6940 family protein [Pseudomonadota bacterium]